MKVQCTKRRIAVFASGNGSNFQSIIDQVQSGELSANVCLLVCDQKQALVIKRAEKAGIPTFVFCAKDFQSKVDYEKRILIELQQYSVDWIILAGYMRLIGQTLLSVYENRIVNIHPSLLPAFPGKDAIGQAISANVKVTGITIHFIDEGMDTGPIISQKACEIEDNDNLERLQSKIQALEHKWYPIVLQQLFIKEDIKESRVDGEDLF